MTEVTNPAREKVSRLVRTPESGEKGAPARHKDKEKKKRKEKSREGDTPNLPEPLMIGTGLLQHYKVVSQTIPEEKKREEKIQKAIAQLVFTELSVREN